MEIRTDGPLIPRPKAAVGTNGQPVAGNISRVMQRLREATQQAYAAWQTRRRERWAGAPILPPEEMTGYVWSRAKVVTTQVGGDLIVQIEMPDYDPEGIEIRQLPNSLQLSLIVAPADEMPTDPTERRYWMREAHDPTRLHRVIPLRVNVESAAMELEHATNQLTVRLTRRQQSARKAPKKTAQKPTVRTTRTATPKPRTTKRA